MFPNNANLFNDPKATRQYSCFKIMQNYAMIQKKTENKIYFNCIAGGDFETAEKKKKETCMNVQKTICNVLISFRFE